jgi:hypothetical protein
MKARPSAKCLQVAFQRCSFLPLTDATTFRDYYICMLLPLVTWSHNGTNSSRDLAGAASASTISLSL